MSLFQKENNIDKKQKMKKKKCIKNLKKNVEPQKIKVVRKYDKRVLHFGTLALELYCAALYVLLSNHLFQRKQEHDG